MTRERMNVVIVGHVDHGKSTVIGRLLADTGALPEGKLEQVRAHCAANAKPFEYAFLLDALKDERAQGITIDTARCFFKTAKRDYIILDAPGHVEFLKNLITGAARADAALLVVDAREGIQDSTRRHAQVAALLGIRQMVVLVNKMDLVDWSAEAYGAMSRGCEALLESFGHRALAFIPISAVGGDNLSRRSERSPWYGGPTLLEQMDALTPRRPSENLPFRLPVQAVYKFTENGDSRRIVAGTIESGRIRRGDEVVFWPSNQRARVKTVEEFNAPERAEAAEGEAVGFTLDAQLFVQPGDLMARADEPAPLTGRRFKANVFWVGRQALVPGRSYRLKLATARVPVRLLSVLNASEAPPEADAGVARHRVATAVFETARPVAFDLWEEVEGTGRFVLVDGYEIAGGGVIRERALEPAGPEAPAASWRSGWETGVMGAERWRLLGRRPLAVLVTDGSQAGRARALAREVEKALLEAAWPATYLGRPEGDFGEADPHRLAEAGWTVLASGQIFVTDAQAWDGADWALWTAAWAPHEILWASWGDPGGAARPNLVLDEEGEEEAALLRVVELVRARAGEASKE